MSTQQPWQLGDDGIALKPYIDVIVGHMWPILALVVAAVAVAGIVSYFLVPPTYESAVVVSLPAAGAGNGLGMAPQAYEEFAVSNPVMNAVQQKLGSNPTTRQFRRHYDVQLDADARLLAGTASAETAEEAVQLASLWVDAFHEQALALFQEQFTAQKTAAEQALNEVLSELTQAEDALASFDRGLSISLMEARLSGREDELVGGETRLRQLTLFSIPTDEARLTFLEAALATEPPTLGGTPGDVALPGEGGNAGVVGSGVTILNPVYLQLNQDLADTRTRLATSKKEVAILEDRIPSLQDEVNQLRDRIVTSSAERQRLDRKVKEGESLYEVARMELDGLLAIEGRLPELSRPGVVSEPVFPEAPVAPRKVLNMALAGVMAALTGVLIAFLVEWYRSKPASADSTP